MQNQISASVSRFGLTILCLIAAILLASCDTGGEDENRLAPDEGIIEEVPEEDPGDEPVDTLEEVLLQNAESYAKDYNVTVDEAMRRLRLQGSLQDTLANLEEATGDRFAGAWIEHEPEFRAIVRLTGSQEVPTDAQSLVESSEAPIEFVYGAEAPLDQLIGELESALPQLQEKYGQLVGTEVDVRSGEIVFFIEQLDVTEEEELTVLEETIKRDAAEILELPVRVEFVDAPVGDGHTRGGAFLSSCTSGFVVRHPSTGTRGYITAGHCGNNQTYSEYGGVSYSTTFIDEIRDADQDVQWHTTTHIELPHFYASSTTSYRPLQAQRNRSSQAVGGYVCHRGMTTGYSCGYIESKTFRPTYTNACPGVTCASVWVRVEGSSLKCFPGDSGGPWFLVYTSYGIYKGQSSSGTSASNCNWAFYMAANYFGIDLVFD